MLESIVDVKPSHQDPSTEEGAVSHTVKAEPSPDDLIDIWTWNATVPQSVDTCVHDLIAQTVSQRPSAIAISAWDGE